MRDLITQLLDALQTTTSITTEKEIDPNLWSWSSGVPTNGTFMISNKLTYTLLLFDPEEWKMLNKHWGKSDKK